LQENARIVERDRRIALFNQLMERNGLDALVFTSTAQQTCQMAVKYLSDYTLTTRRNFAYMEKAKCRICFCTRSVRSFTQRV